MQQLSFPSQDRNNVETLSFIKRCIGLCLVLNVLQRTNFKHIFSCKHSVYANEPMP